MRDASCEFSEEERKEERLHRHFPAAFCAAAASLDAIVHVADPLTFVGAVVADVGAFGAEMLVVRRAQDHDMRGRPAGLRAGQHELDMTRSGMLATLFQAVPCDHAEAGLVAAKAGVHAGLHVLIDVMHCDVS